MAADEQTRQRVYALLRDSLGEEVATTLMAGLPPFSWSEVATKADLASLGDELRGEMTALRDDLRGDMTALRGELRGEMGELRGEMGRMEARLSLGTATTMTTMMRYSLATTVGAVLTTGALAFAAAGLS